MRITLDIDDRSLTRIQRHTGIRKKSPAVARALDLYLREIRKKKLLQKIMEGESSFGFINDELEQRSVYDSH